MSGAPHGFRLVPDTDKPDGNSRVLYRPGEHDHVIDAKVLAREAVRLPFPQPGHDLKTFVNGGWRRENRRHPFWTACGYRPICPAIWGSRGVAIPSTRTVYL